ncbi:MAG: hypothetical protein SFU56_04940 [Capsulimonadales bacterium]|nr:hypothetical protein [Capsulimonadales bacterium]
MARQSDVLEPLRENVAVLGGPAGEFVAQVEAPVDIDPSQRKGKSHSDALIAMYNI